MSYFPPPPSVPPRVGLFRRVPPAIFPALLGLLGLALAWQRAVVVFGLDRALVDVATGAACVVFLAGTVAYGAKAVLRPGAVIEDMRTLPGRTGLSALAMALMSAAALLAPMWPGLALVCLATGLAGLATIAIGSLVASLRGRTLPGR